MQIMYHILYIYCNHLVVNSFAVLYFEGTFYLLYVLLLMVMVVSHNVFGRKFFDKYMYGALFLKFSLSFSNIPCFIGCIK